MISAAALSPEAAAIAPDPLAFQACTELGRAIDLGRIDETQVSAPGAGQALIRLAEEHSLCAARIVLGADGEADALLLIGAAANDAPAAVRPRTLALLDEEANRVASERSGVLASASELAMQPEVQRLDRLAALGSLVGELVHEVRNPLSAVKTFLELLPEHLDDEEFTGNFRDVVRDEVQRVERLLSAFGQQAHAARRGGEAAAGSARESSIAISAPAAIANEISTLLEMSARERAIDLGVEIDEATPPVAIDPDELRQLLLNLSLNAIDATPIHGVVRLRAEREDDDAPLSLFVDDSGPGVPDSQRQLVFEPFHSTRSGTPGGLGLAIARRIAERAGGTIDITSSPEGGARFRLRLPIAKGALADRLIVGD